MIIPCLSKIPDCKKGSLCGDWTCRSGGEMGSKESASRHHPDISSVLRENKEAARIAATVFGSIAMAEKDIHAALAYAGEISRYECINLRNLADSNCPHAKALVVAADLGCPHAVASVAIGAHVGSKESDDSDYTDDEEYKPCSCCAGTNTICPGFTAKGAYGFTSSSYRPGMSGYSTRGAGFVIDDEGAGPSGINAPEEGISADDSFRTTASFDDSDDAQPDGGDDLPDDYVPTYTDEKKETHARTEMKVIRRFGVKGKRFGQLRQPKSVAVNDIGEVIVADNYNHRIQVFKKFGPPERRCNTCKKPKYIAVSPKDDNIVVTNGHKVEIYDKWLSFLFRFNIPEASQGLVVGIAVDVSHNIILLMSDSPRVRVFERDGGELYNFNATGDLIKPVSVSACGDEIYICDAVAEVVKIFTYHGDLLSTLGGKAMTEKPFAVSITQHATVLVAGKPHGRFQLTHLRRDGSVVGGYHSLEKHKNLQDMAYLPYEALVVIGKNEIFIYSFNEHSIMIKY